MRALAAAAISAVVLLGGCQYVRDASPPERLTRIEASDRDIVLPSIRIGANVHTFEPRTAPAHAQGGHGIEFSATRARGHDHQILRTTERPIVFGDNTFTPPQDLKNEFDLEVYDLVYRWRPYFGAGRFLGMEVIGGPAIASLDMKVSSATQNARHTYDVMGFTVGAGFVYRFHRATSLRIRVSSFFTAADESLTSQRLEYFVGHALSRHVALRAGYTMQQWWASHANDDLSEINLRFSGPTIGLDLMF